MVNLYPEFLPVKNLSKFLKVNSQNILLYRWRSARAKIARGRPPVILLYAMLARKKTARERRRTRSSTRLSELRISVKTSHIEEEIQSIQILEVAQKMHR